MTRRFAHETRTSPDRPPPSVAQEACLHDIDLVRSHNERGGLRIVRPGDMADTGDGVGTPSERHR
jgi:hypothetical protein